MPREQGIHESIMKAIRREYPKAKVLKHHASRYTGKGHPDLYGCIDGYAFVIEVKQPGEEPEPVQYAQLEQWRKAGAIAGWATSADEALAIIARGLF